MEIATYNINGRLEILLRRLKEGQPDILCLQELKAENHKFPEKAINEAVTRARRRASLTAIAFWSVFFLNGSLMLQNKENRIITANQNNCFRRTLSKS